MKSDQKKVRAKRMLLYLGIFSIVMLFAGLTSGYVVALNGEFWVNIVMPEPFYWSTALIVLSSVTMIWAVRSAKKGNQQLMSIGVLLSLGLGIAFSISQFQGWKDLTERGMYLSSFVDNLEGEYGEEYTFKYKGTELVKEDGNFYFPDDYYKEDPLNDQIAVFSNTASSFMYILTAVHLVHLVGGLIALVLVAIGALMGKKYQSKASRLRLTAVYWHFLDGLWIYLFLFLAYIH